MIPDDNATWMRLRTAICLTLGVAGAAALLKQMLTGNSVVGAGIFAVIVVFGLFLWLQQRYWMLVVLAMIVPMPVIPFGPRWMILSELVVPLAFIFLLANRAVHKTGRVWLVSGPGITPLAYTAWAAMIYSMNPSGFLMMGSGLTGARFYLKIALGLLSFFILSNQKIRDREALWVIFLIVAGSVGQAIHGIAQWKLGVYQAYEGQFYTWQPALTTPLLWMSILLFSVYGVDLLLRVPSWQGLLFSAMVVTSLFTGKRMGVAGIAAVPLVTALVRRHGLLRCAVWAAVLVLMLGCMVAGHGRMFRLPLLIQRSLSYMPGLWDVQVEEGIGYDFRQRLRERALDIVKDKPLFGLKGYALTIEDLPWQSVWGQLSDPDMAASGRNWHTTWLGIAADFGIPAAVIWGLFYLQFVWTAHKTRQIAAITRRQHTLVLMIYVYLVIEIARSMTGGHSALLAYDMWWLYGLVVAVSRTLAEEPPAPADAGTGV